MSEKLKPWIEARDRHGLTDAQVQMARELALNPRKLGAKVRARADDRTQSVAEWVEQQYSARFGKDAPDQVASIEERAEVLATRKSERQQRRQVRKQTESEPDQSSAPPTEPVRPPAAEPSPDAPDHTSQESKEEA